MVYSRSKTFKTLISKLVEPQGQPMVSEPSNAQPSPEPRGLTFRPFILKGIPINWFTELQDLSPLTESEWAGFLGLSTKSLQRYKLESNFKFKPLQSEKLIQFAEVMALAETIFDDHNQAFSWFREPNPRLGGLSPAQAIHDAYGKALVVQVLHQIDHGVFA